MVLGKHQDGLEGNLTFFFSSGISCLIQMTQKNISKSFVLFAEASAREILPLSFRVAIPRVQ